MKDEDIIKLSEASSLVKKMLEEKRKIALINQEDFMPDASGFDSRDPFTFHPNGNCGCCQANDDYMFGIRCNHLMWAEGFCEGGESFWSDLNLENDDPEWKDDCVLIYGNHKGFFIMKLLVFY